jgi:hypothetical protein
MQVDTAEKKEVAANAAKATALKDKVEFSAASECLRMFIVSRLEKDNVDEYARQDEAQAQAKEITTQSTALKTKLDAAVLEASILTKGLEDALAHSKAEIERLQVTVFSCISFRVSADQCVLCVHGFRQVQKNGVYCVPLLPFPGERMPSADRRLGVRSGVARKAVWRG